MPFGHGHRNRGGGVPLDSHDEAVMAEFRRDVWQFGLVGFGAGICGGFLATPFLRRFVGKHANVAVPLSGGALFSMLGSAIAANHHAHSMSYAMFKRQESIKAQTNSHQQHYARRREAKEAASQEER